MIEVQKKALEPKEFVKVVKNRRGITELIGHNRNATTNIIEKDKDKEAHPFLSENKEFAICHNGHITYHEVLRQYLELVGHNFTSGGVDSEVLVHILEELLARYSRDIAMERFFHILDGENVLVLFKDKELYGYPTNSFFKVVKIDGGIMIASSFDSFTDILKATEGDVMGYYPDFIKSNQMVKAVIEDGKVSLSLFGAWEESCFKHENFVAHNKIRCDYCGESVVTERFNDHDRCLDCYKANKDKTLSEIRSSKASYNSLRRGSNILHSSESELKEIWAKCEICESFMTLERMTFCHKCNKILCKQCNADKNKHTCGNPVYID